MRIEIEVQNLKIRNSKYRLLTIKIMSPGENILPIKLIIIREKFLQKGLLGKFYKEKLENS